MPDTVTHVVAANVRAELARKGVSARTLGADLQKGRGWAYSRLRQNNPEPLNVQELVEIAEYLGIPVARLTEVLSEAAAAPAQASA